MKINQIKFTEIAVILFLFFTCSSCQKQLGSDYKNLNPNSLVGAARSWYSHVIVEKEKETLALPFSTLPKNAYARVFKRMEKLGELLNWDDAKEYNQDGFHYLVVIVNQKIKPLSNQNFEAVRGLVFYKDNFGKMQMNIIEALSKKGRNLGNSIQDIVSIAFSNKYFDESHTIKNMNANVIFYDENYKLGSSYETINGTWAKVNIKLLNKATVKLLKNNNSITQRQFASTTSQAGSCGTCTTWYSVGYWYDLQTGYIVSTEILNTWTDCTGGNDPPSAGYGNAPDPPADADCAVTTLTALDNLTSNSTVSDETESIMTTVSLPETRTKKYQWKILKNVGWYIFSWEKGIHVKTTNSNPNLQWQWQTFDHQGVSLVGTVVGGNVDYSIITSNSTLGLYNAVMDLDLRVKYEVVCKGSPFSTELAYNCNKMFNIND